MARESKSRAEFSSDLWIGSWMVGILGSEADAGVSFLAGPEGGWINSQVLRPNGGFVY